MGSLKLTGTDLAELRQFYQEELERTVKRLQHIKSVLDTLGDDATKINIQITSSQTATGSAPVSKVKSGRPDTGKVKQKRGPKSIWDELIVKRLQHVGKPLSYEEMTDEIMALGNIAKDKRKNTKQAINSAVFRMRRQKGLLDTFSAGTKEKYIALKHWFDTRGKIKDEFKPQAPSETTVEVKPKAKRGRKPGKANVAKATAAKPKTVKPKAAKPKTAKPRAAKPKAAKPRTAKPKTAETPEAASA